MVVAWVVVHSASIGLLMPQGFPCHTLCGKESCRPSRILSYLFFRSSPIPPLSRRSPRDLLIISLVFAFLSFPFLPISRVVFRPCFLLLPLLLLPPSPSQFTFVSFSELSIGFFLFFFFISLLFSSCSSASILASSRKPIGGRLEATALPHPSKAASLGVV